MSRRLRFYKKLVHFYPAAYRARYGEQMCQTVEDMLEHVNTTPRRMLIWTKILSDLPMSLVKAQFQSVGVAYHRETPSYIKQSGLLAVILLLPFFLALTANGLDKVMYSNDLNNSRVWHMPFIGIWMLWLPRISLVIALVSYALYAWGPSKTHQKTTHSRRAFDVMHVWPVMVPGMFAFGILFIVVFHDSVHCWVQNPAHFVTKFHQTLSCTEHGSAGRLIYTTL